MSDSNSGSYLLDHPFQPGLVRGYLSKSDYRTIVGIDFGDGETTVYLYRRPKQEDDKKKDSPKKAVLEVKRVQIDRDGNPKIPTYISYSSGAPQIGHDAVEDPDLMQHFKAPPGRWGAKLDGTHTQKEMIRDFLKVLWNQARQYDDDFATALQSDDVLIAMGCPASLLWTNRKAIRSYSALIRKATGWKNVAILPESTAAIMSSVLSSSTVDVCNSLDTLDSDVVCALNIGLLETSVNLFHLENRRWKGQRLALDSRGSFTIPTRIRYAPEQILIGAEAVDQPGEIKHFRYPPSHWNAPLPKRKSTGPSKGKNTGILLADYIRTLWAQLLACNKSLQEYVEKGTLVLAMGVPSNRAWTSEDAQQALQELLMDATSMASVRPFPEKILFRAGIGLIPQALSDGIAIIDAGSSTIDFTYVYMGKALITASMPIAGSKINELMQKKILTDSKMNLSDIPFRQRQDVLVQLCHIKESHFSAKGRNPRVRGIPLWGPGADGLGDPTQGSGKQLTFLMNKAFMRDVLWKDTSLKLSSLGSPWSWGQHCRDFIQRTRLAIGDLPCNRVILTGGTSYVTDLQRIVAGCYGREKVCVADNPSASVAMGLCCAKGMESRAGASRLTVEKDLTEVQWPAAYREFFDTSARYIGSVICDIARQKTEEYAKSDKTVKFSTFIQDVARRTKYDPRISGREEIPELSEAYKAALDKGGSSTVQAVNKLSASLYGPQFSASPALKAQDIRLEKNYIELLRPGAMLGKSLITAITGGVIDTVAVVLMIAGIHCLIASPLLGFGTAAGGLALCLTSNYLGEKLFEVLDKLNIQIKPKLAGYIANYLEDPENREKVIENLREHIIDKSSATISGAPMYADFMASMDEFYEISLGKVLFLVFDQPPRQIGKV